MEYRRMADLVSDKTKVNYIDVYVRIVETLSKTLGEMEVYVLKCHLILEKEMVNFVEYKCGHEVNFPFNMLKRVVIEMYDGFGATAAMKKDIETFVQLLTDLRNQIAHSLKYEDATMQKAMQVSKKISSDMKDTEPQPAMFDSTIANIAIILVLASGRTLYEAYPDDFTLEDESDIEAAPGKDEVSDYKVEE